MLSSVKVFGHDSKPLSNGSIAFRRPPEYNVARLANGKPDKKASPSLSLTPAEILQQYRIAVLSRQVSRIGQREVMSGHAKFGVFGAGKEVAQLALAHLFRTGDFRAGYYRDQTLMFALGLTTPEAFLPKSMPTMM